MKGRNTHILHREDMDQVGPALQQCSQTVPSSAHLPTSQRKSELNDLDGFLALWYIIHLQFLLPPGKFTGKTVI